MGWRCGSATVVPSEPWAGGVRREELEGWSRMEGLEEESGGARRHWRRTTGMRLKRGHVLPGSHDRRSFVKRGKGSESFIRNKLK
jgi:hypothetical protein